MPSSEEGTAPSYLIVGAGIFGAATALHLKRSHPDAAVTLLDRTAFPNPSSASFDLNKIVRSDYHDIFYMKLALEAQELWRNDSLYKPYYHETGMLFAENVRQGTIVLGELQATRDRDRGEVNVGCRCMRQVSRV